jgi:hypothetical protein
MLPCIGGTAGHLLSDVTGVVGICDIIGVVCSGWVTTLNLPCFTAVVVIGLSLVSEFQDA